MSVMIAAASEFGSHSKERPRPADRTWRTYFAGSTLVAQAVLVGLVVVTPWLFGGVDPVVQIWLFVGVIVALACWLLSRIADRSLGSVLPVAVVPLICALCLGLFQLVPLGAETRALFSPSGAELRSALLGDDPTAEGSLEENLGVAAAPERQPLSLYPASTRNDLALLTLAVAVFLLGASFFKTPKAQIWLCGLIAVNGAAIAFIALVQRITGKVLYETITPERDGSWFGPFVNQNNAGGFLVLCLAGAVGLTVWVVGRSGPGGSAAGEFRPPENRPLLAQMRHRLLDFFSNLNAPTLAVMSLTGFIAAGILCSLSRGAAVAMIGATILTILVVLATRRRTAGVWAIAVAAMMVFGLVSWVGMTDIVQARLATVFDEETVAKHSLLPHWGDGLRAVPEFWQVGSGLGTYRYVYELHQQQPIKAWFEHAENQYLESAVEGGIVGFGLMLALFGLVGLACWRLLRHDRDLQAFAFGIATIFALGGQAIAGAFDFGLYIPANLLLFALLCGAVSGRAAELVKKGTSPGLLALRRGRFLSPALVALLLTGMVLGCLEIRRAAAVDVVMRSIQFDGPPTEISIRDVEDSIKELETATQHRQDDAEAQKTLARLQILLYRLRAVEQYREGIDSDREQFEQREEEPPPAVDDLTLWEWTSLEKSQYVMHRAIENNDLDVLEELRSTPLVEDHVRPALKHLLLARRSCPLLPEVHLLIAQLCGFVADPVTDRIHLARLRQLAPSRPELLFQCGLLELQAARAELAAESWKRCLTISAGRPEYSHFEEEILRIAGPELATPGMIAKLLPDDPKELVRLARDTFKRKNEGEKQEEDDADAKVHDLLVQRAEELLEQIDLPPGEQYYLRGAVCELKGDFPQAIDNYRRAVELRYEEVPWRYELAVLLKKQGRIDEAHKEARLCALREPHKLEYRRLLEEINHTRSLGTSSPR